MNTLSIDIKAQTLGARFSALMIGFFGAGCAVDASTSNRADAPVVERTATTDNPLVGGTATNYYPEIGRHWRPGPGIPATWLSCTATLFAPQYVITAAHCVGFTDITPRFGEVFTIIVPSSVAHNYPIDRIASFGTRRYEYTPGGKLTTDIAIMHLTTPVPSTIATPRSLAKWLPSPLARVTTYGYGCTQRVPAAGGGYKQFFPWDYDTATTALCPGDSGGPAVFGDWSDAGAIWGVNSDYTGADAQFPSWTDVYADVPFMLPRINETIRQWEAQ